MRFAFLLAGTMLLTVGGVGQKGDGQIPAGAWGGDRIHPAGGSFVQGGYTGTIIPVEMNPLDGRSVWTGSSGGFITTIVNLPSSAAGKMVRLRWRMGSGLTVGGVGWRIDSVSLTDSVRTCAG